MMININLHEQESKSINVLGALVKNINNDEVGIVYSEYANEQSLNVLILKSDDLPFTSHFEDFVNLGEVLNEFEILKYKNEYDMNIISVK